jgi:hypothetical protein
MYTVYILHTISIKSNVLNKKNCLALTETVSMEEAVSKALELTNEKETLIIVTGDHSHVFSMGGYNYRGNDILGNVFVVVNSILFVVCQCS